MGMICDQCKEYTTMTHCDTDKYICPKCRSKNIEEAHSKYEVQKLFGVSYEELQTALEFYKGVVFCENCEYFYSKHGFSCDSLAYADPEQGEWCSRGKRKKDNNGGRNDD